MPLPFEEFEDKGFLGFLNSSSDYKIHGGRREDLCYVVNNGGFSEPTSVLDSIRRSSSPLVSSSTTTLSSSHGGPIAGATVFSGADEKSDQMGFEDLDGVLSEFVGFDTGSGSDPVIDIQNPLFDCSFPFSDPSPPEEEVEEKFQIPTNPETLTNPNPGYFSITGSCHPSKRLNSGQPDSYHNNPGYFSVTGSSPPSKRLNSGQPDSNHNNPGYFPVSGSSLPAKRLNSGQPDSNHNKPGFLSVSGSSPPSKRLNSGHFSDSNLWVFHFSDPGHESHDPFITPSKLPGNETVIIDELFIAAVELIGTTVHGGDNNPILAQEILARLNHNLNQNPNTNPKPPFHRAALYITEALQSLLLQESPSSPQTLIPRIAAYRAFSETSPFLQFVNFTANQTILESVEGFDRIHIVDFDIGYGGQWSSLIQELAGGKRNRSSLKITAFVSPSTVSDEFELRFTEQNLRAFAGEIGVDFEIEFLNIEVLLNQIHWPVSLLRSSEKEGVAVNLPISSVVSGYLPLILRFFKEISPNVVVCSDRSCDRNNDAPFPNGVIHALQYYTSLLESLDVAGNPNNQEVERFYVQPSIRRLLTNRYRWIERSPPWRSLFGQCGFTPVMLSQTAETQAEYLLQRNPMRGFHLEKRQSSSSSLVLCWQKKELVAVSAWKC